MHRPRKPSEAYQRLSTLPGEQAQVDWAHFGSVTIGRATRKLYAFVMVLSWSRATRGRDSIQSELLEFAGHYRFEPRPVAVARGNEKGAL